MSGYYDGTKLLSLKDLSGKEPEIYMCTTNRTGGKTTYFNRLVVNKFLKGQGKFGLLYRYNYELDNVADKFFKDISTLFFPDKEMTSERRANGIYHELFLDGVSCGYAITLNSSDQIKKMSHLFSDINRIIFDEFQSETNHYCNDEITKFLSIHKSIARGQGKQHRYVPVYMLGNCVTLLNPYYTSMGISNRLNDGVKFLRGNGFVLEQGYIDSAAKAQEESGVSKAFAKDNYIAYSTQSVYLNDNHSFIDKPAGSNRYLCTLKYKGSYYAIREYSEDGYLYCDDRPDMTFPNKITVTTDDHQINYVMLKRNDFFLVNLRYLFEKGCFRFKDLMCKEVVLCALSY